MFRVRAICPVGGVPTIRTFLDWHRNQEEAVFPNAEAPGLSARTLDSIARRRVRRCLEQAKFIVCCTVLNDLRHEQSLNVRILMSYFVEHCGAILHVEDEGYFAPCNRRLPVV